MQLKRRVSVRRGGDYNEVPQATQKESRPSPSNCVTPSACKLLSEQGCGFRKANVIECGVFLFAIYNSALHSFEGKSIFPGNNAAEAMAFDISSAQWPVPPPSACACACASALTRTQHCSTSRSSCGFAHGIDFNPLLKLEISLTSRRSALKKKDVSRFELGLIQTQMAQKPMLRAEVYASALRASQNRITF